jgi:FHA domain
MPDLTDAMKRSLGHLRLWAIPPTSFVTENGDTTMRVEIKPPGAVIGRGADADIRVLDDEGYVSRLHLAIETRGLQWIIRDHNSTHGTHLKGPDARLALPAQVPMPIKNGDEIMMAAVAGFTIEIIAKAPSGVRTKDPTPTDTARIDDPDILKLASALVQRRRDNPLSTSPPSARELGAIFDVERRTIYYRLDKLKAIPEIKRQIPHLGASMSQIADAVALAFPYLIDR